MDANFDWGKTNVNWPISIYYQFDHVTTNWFISQKAPLIKSIQLLIWSSPGHNNMNKAKNPEYRTGQVDIAMEQCGDQIIWHSATLWVAKVFNTYHPHPPSQHLSNYFSQGKRLTEVEAGDRTCRKGKAGRARGKGGGVETSGLTHATHTSYAMGSLCVKR